MHCQTQLAKQVSHLHVKKTSSLKGPTLKLLKILSRLKQDTLHEITMVRFYYRLES